MGEIERLLELYGLEELLENNDMTVAQALSILVEEGYIELPDYRPLASDEE